MMLHKIVWIFFTILLCEAFNETMLIDFKSCKLTLAGNEYEGSVSTTSAGIRCQTWYGENQIHEVNRIIMHQHFPDGSMVLAKNYCRNPTSDKRGPWCYTVNPNVKNDYCDIPLCNSGDCRISGTGSEYGGSIKVSLSGKECKYWDNEYNQQKKNAKKCQDKDFPEKSCIVARNYCRNPDNDPGGPWCYVYDENFDNIHKEYCDIPFCDDRNCLFYSRETDVYSTITKIKNGAKNITVWIKIWNPADLQKTAARLLMSNLPIPTSGKNIANEWNAGAEIMISNVLSGLIYPNLDIQTSFEITPHSLSGKKWTGFTVVWNNGIISVFLLGSAEPLFIREYNIENTTSSNISGGYLYYGFVGDGLLWSMDSCQKTCEVHTTFGQQYMKVWPIRMENDDLIIEFHIRASTEISLQFYSSPIIHYPCVTIIFEYENKVSIIYEENEKSKQYIVETKQKGLLDYWEWRKFVIIHIGTRIYILSVRNAQTYQILLGEHSRLTNIWKWFSIGSSKIAHWTLYCTPELIDTVEETLPPNCLTSLAEEYSGSQWFGQTFEPCIPWTSEHIPVNEKQNSLFPEKSVINASNKCRNPINNSGNPYCYVMWVASETEKFIKMDCIIRNCQSSDCRITGTANDYIGTLSVTRSGRDCAPWLEQAYSNDSYYQENSIEKDSNYCRNPSQTAAGTWCYTTDPLVPRELCDVTDCKKPESCIILIRGPGSERLIYILPKQRTSGIPISVKIWNPKKPDFLEIIFSSDDKLQSGYKLIIGANNNKEIELYYKSENKDFELVAREKLLYLLHIGKWSNFVIKIARGKIQVYYENTENPIFDWQHPESTKFVSSIYYSFSTEKNFMAVVLDCILNCPVELTTTNYLSKILSIPKYNMNRDPNEQVLHIYMRASGVVGISFLLFPEPNEYYTIYFNEKSIWMSFLEQENSNPLTLHEQEIPVYELLNESTWTNITLIWLNHIIMVLWNNTQIYRFEHTRPFVFYFFSVIAENGSQATWTANCVPPSIDKDFRDGEWSEWGPWSCSASCDGGVGIRKRICNSPQPNIKGESCLGPDKITGKCNTMACGDISEEIITLIAQRKRTNFTALVVKEGKTISIQPDTDIIDRIIKESPQSNIEWTHNGIIFRTQKNRTNIQNYNINIKSAKIVDSGVYAITFHRDDGTYLILKVVTLSVIPIKTTITIRRLMSMTIVCHCTVLAYVYANLRVSWLINNKTWKSYGPSLPFSVNVDSVFPINQSHSGLWECLVKEDSLNFYWITNIVRVNVIGASNWRTHLMEDSFTKPIFGWMPNELFVICSVILLFLIFIVSIIFGLYSFFKFRKKKDKKLTVIKR